MTQQVAIVDQIAKLAKPFDAQNSFGLKFESECLFAKQQLMKNNFSLNTAANNQASLRGAILNVAAIGITLNPALAHAYLVPRDGAICLDVSYRGLVKLATDSGAIEWAKAVLVYEGDEFKWRGPAEAPLHEADVFDEKRINAKSPLDNLKGGYCIAKLSTGEVMVEVMTAGEITAVRDSSKAKKGPWAGKWAGEMAKKTLVKRASKSWPQSNGRQRLDDAIQILNEHEGLEDEPIKASDYLKPSKEQTETYLELAKGDTVDFFLWYNAQDERIKTALPGVEFEHGKKQAMMKHFNALLEEGRLKMEGWTIDLTALCDAMDEHGTAEFLAEFPNNQREALIEGILPEYRIFAQQQLKEVA